MATVEKGPLIWQNHSRKRPQAFCVCASQARGLTYELDLKRILRQTRLLFGKFWVITLLACAPSPRCQIPESHLRWLSAHLRLRSEEHTSELQSLMRISYAVFCLKKKNNNYSSPSFLREKLKKVHV